MSRAGQNYRAANGSPIPNLGQAMVHFRDAQDRACGIPFQIAAVERPLLSVSRMAAAGCDVVFTGSTGCITSTATGRALPLVRSGGVYVLRMRLPRAPKGEGSPRRGPAGQPFARQGP